MPPPSTTLPTTLQLSTAFRPNPQGARSSSSTITLLSSSIAALISLAIIRWYANREKGTRPTSLHDLKQMLEESKLATIHLAQHTLVVTQRILNAAANIPNNTMDGLVSKSSGLVSNIQNFPQRQFDTFLDSQMDTLGEKAKSIMSDPYMPRALLRLVDEAVDALLPDAKRLVLLKTDEIIRRNREVTYDDTSVIVVGGRKRRPKQKPTTFMSWISSTATGLYSNTTGLVTNYTPAVITKLQSNVVDTTTRTVDTYTPSILKNITSTTYARTSDVLQRAWHTGTHWLPGSTLFTTTPEKTSSDEVLSDMLSGYADEDESSMLSNPSNGIIRSFLLRCRAHVLYISAPCDKSFWQCLRDPYWILLTLIGLAPYGVGTVWWLILFAMHDKSDEFQVANFIVGFMCSKFAGGIGLTVYGSLLYYICATRDEPTCVQDGPRVSSEMTDGLFFFLQVLLVWSCYFVLRHTRECRSVLDERDAFLVVDMERVHEKLGGTRSRGGRLAHMFWWETLCVCLILGMAAFAFLMLELRTWKFRATLFWLKALFGLLSLPFVVFKLPVISTLLMQVRATGYDRHGRLVLHVRSPPDEERIRKLQEFQAQMQRSKASSPYLGTTAAAVAAAAAAAGAARSARVGLSPTASSTSTGTNSVDGSNHSVGDGNGPTRRFRRQSSGDELLANISEGEEEDEDDDGVSQGLSTPSNEAMAEFQLDPVMTMGTVRARLSSSSGVPSPIVAGR